MLIAHEGVRPTVAETAWVAPDATICGDVRIEAGARILYGARIVAEGGSRIDIGENCIVMENAVIRSTPRHACSIGAHCLIGPNSHIVGAKIESQVFVATGASVFHGAIVEHGSEIRINAVVHIRTRLASGTTIPIGWIAVGDPVQILSPDRHEDIWSIQKPLGFPEWVYGVDRGTPNLMVAITDELRTTLANHSRDELLGPP